jgi:hypothetical protein
VLLLGDYIHFIDDHLEVHHKKFMTEEDVVCHPMGENYYVANIKGLFLIYRNFIRRETKKLDDKYNKQYGIMTIILEHKMVRYFTYYVL